MKVGNFASLPHFAVGNFVDFTACVMAKIAYKIKSYLLNAQMAELVDALASGAVVDSYKSIPFPTFTPKLTNQKLRLTSLQLETFIAQIRLTAITLSDGLNRRFNNLDKE